MAKQLFWNLFKCGQVVVALAFQILAHFDLSNLKLAHMSCFNLNGKLVEVFYLVLFF